MNTNPLEMDKRPMKTVGESQTEQVQIVLPEQINGDGRLFGGRLMEWIDIVAAVVARRHAHRNVTTAAVDYLEFKAAAHLNDTVLLVGRMTWVGNTSMEVRVDTYVESLGGTKSLINRAYLVLVAIDEEENPVPVPGLYAFTPEEKAEQEAGARRRELRRQRRAEQY